MLQKCRMWEANWPFFKTADFSINNAINPTNLGAK